MVQEVKTTHKFGNKPYLGFEHITMTPLCKKLINETLLTPKEKDWVNSYHAEIFAKTERYFKDDERTLKWLTRETEPM
jgi:Xaa-Pro aminopeptidase